MSDAKIIALQADLGAPAAILVHGPYASDLFFPALSLQGLKSAAASQEKLAALLEAMKFAAVSGNVATRRAPGGGS